MKGKNLSSSGFLRKSHVTWFLVVVSALARAISAEMSLKAKRPAVAVQRRPDTVEKRMECRAQSPRDARWSNS